MQAHIYKCTYLLGDKQRLPRNQEKVKYNKINPPRKGLGDAVRGWRGGSGGSSGVFEDVCLDVSGAIFDNKSKSDTWYKAHHASCVVLNCSSSLLVRWTYS